MMISIYKAALTRCGTLLLQDAYFGVDSTESTPTLDLFPASVLCVPNKHPVVSEISPSILFWLALIGIPDSGPLDNEIGPIKIQLRRIWVTLATAKPRRRLGPIAYE